MTAADQIHALADTVLPGECTCGFKRTTFHYDLCPASGKREPSAADRALPHIADLIGVVDDEHRQFSESCVMCGGLWPCDYAAARDALVQALGVTP